LILSVALPGLATLSVIDRDEARFAQASVQMAESGDLLNIRFQDEARNKKPAGIYWLQTTAIKALSKDGEREIWVQRLPSVLGALIAVLATYWGGAKLIGREPAFIGAAALALSMMMVFEAHIAKTDAMLCGLAALCFASLAHIRHTPSGLSLWRPRPTVWLFWLALSGSILIKGPVVPTLVALSCTTLLIWERRGYGIRQLINIPAITLSLLLFVPWAIAIGVETNGAFFSESLGDDLGGKIVSTQESHAGPPGYYLAFINLILWPATLLLLPAFTFVLHTLKTNINPKASITKLTRLCVAWIIPFWILIELMPTKLPHYVLPLFPALCLLIGLTASALFRENEFGRSRRISAVLFLIVNFAFIVALATGLTLYADFAPKALIFAGLGLGGITAVISAASLWRRKIETSLLAAALSAIVMNGTAYSLILPNLTDLRLANQLVDAFDANDVALPREGGPVVQALNFTEPSLVYNFGKDIRLGDQTRLEVSETWETGRIFIVDTLHKKGDVWAQFQAAQTQQKACTAELSRIEGMNYSRGDTVDLRVIKVIQCTN
jgi:4-amino-4-deoxy-L-arabinose transferase-like glycosyltransferase